MSPIRLVFLVCASMLAASSLAASPGVEACQDFVGQAKGLCIGFQMACVETERDTVGCDEILQSFEDLGVGSMPWTCTENTECDDGDYCAKPAGECGAVGSCEPRPFPCWLAYVPVCGCDGASYSNSCWSAADGVNTAYEGICTPD